MDGIELQFNGEFADWNIRLPPEDIAQRRRGKIVEAGWAIWYLFGADERGEYLDYYASHRMAGETHVRLRVDGTKELLPCLESSRLGSLDPEEDARLDAEYYAQNRQVAAMLEAKGFGLSGDEPGGVQINQYLYLHELAMKDHSTAAPAPLLSEIIASLKQSPLFQLSLASKELFHSNFLAWLCETYPEQAGGIFGGFLQQPSAANCSITRVLREKNNIDLLLGFGDDASLVIENKVKSLPTLIQLEEYSLKFKDKPLTSFLLLSLGQPSFLRSGETTIRTGTGVAWRYLNYQQLAEQIRLVIPEIASINNYHGDMLHDYVGFISNLNHLYSNCAVNCELSETDFFMHEEELAQLRSIRMHDFAQKIRYSQLADRVGIKLQMEGFKVVVHAGFPNALEQFAVGSAMTHGTGLFDMKYYIFESDEPVFLGIQVQGRDFRINLEMQKNKRLAERIAMALLHPTVGSQVWFDFAMLQGASGEYPKKGDFNQYKKLFYYRSRKLARTTVIELVDTIVGFARLIREKEDVLRQQIAACL